MRPVTPSQTVGPFFGFALPYPGGPELVPADHPAAIRLEGRVLDGAGDAVPDALLEIWQATADGHAFGRCPTGPDGSYHFTTVRPPGNAPYLAMLVFARGLLKSVATRVYLTDDADDPLLELVEEARRETLIAESVGGRAYRFDIHLQGERETVFLDL